ncbi:MAG: YfiR family protein [Alphaproteobacteria bacterium]|nr:YfiR family protein [Alphaproteobacteria bacterium]
MAAPAYAAPTPDQIKAVMIRKFVEFIRWPEASAPQKEMLVKICVYGDSAMSGMNAVFSKTSSANAIQYSLSNISQLDNVAGACHVVFISASRQDQLSSILAVLRSKPVLTVSDVNNFAERGGMIGFHIIDGKIRYNINNKAFEAAQLKVDAQLLEIANKVVE